MCVWLRMSSASSTRPYRSKAHRSCIFLNYTSSSLCWRILRVTSLQCSYTLGFMPFVFKFTKLASIFRCHLCIQNKWWWYWRKGVWWEMSVEVISLCPISRSLSGVHSRYVSFSVPRIMFCGHMRKLERRPYLGRQRATLSIINVLLGGKGNRYYVGYK